MKNEDEIYEDTSDIQYVRTPRFRRLYERLSKDDRIRVTNAKGDDALLLDNSHMTIAEQKEWLMQRFRERTSL